MKLILSAGSLHTLPLEKIFELARDTGFDGVEVIINYDFQYQDNLAYLRDLQQILPVASLHAPFFELDGWGNKANQLTRTANLALECGIPLINFHPPSWMAFELRFWRWLKTIDDFQAQIGHGQVIITMENMPCTGAFKTNPYFLGQTRKMIDFLKSHNLFLTFDTAHMGTSKANFLHDFHLFYDSGRMRNIHFSDYGYGREHLLPGHGILPLTRFLNHLRETDYNEALVLELSPREFPEEEELIRESLAEIFFYLCQETRHRVPLHAPDSPEREEEGYYPEERADREPLGV
ncbi:sugar phosphate isomerase/epimerase family protein [Geoalkalibacter halelectricus]|uniref:Sugar phosphate isomerase/epimerase n=1 Tax=Geoalkalibacter halelectricus TaxID=2847045 RepID=A0ABY5ZNW4_9BACT|nr:sugar phosphate isomerase/epimerase family protein [Geoalkalibacter halelectricus]MDO3377403.1 sugar phosphate isomerase/epimerase [Geoalkalibacter halelectricus]UWZ80837.1 sugar phosphate isomerase/epimerase [Geoalkalibacter halelectricus]